MYSEQDVINTLLQKIYWIVASPDSVSNVPTQRLFLSVPMPGVPMAQEALDFGFATMTLDQIELAADFQSLVDKIPSWGATWTDSGSTLSDEYQEILKGPIIPTPNYTDDDRKQYQAAHDLLWATQQFQDTTTGKLVSIEVPSLWVERYDSYKKAWTDAQNAYFEAYQTFLDNKDKPGAAELWSRRKVILTSNINQAFARWESAGKKRVEEAQGVISNFDGRGLAQSWEDRKARLKQYVSSSSSGDFLRTKYIPSKFWSDSSGWLKISISHDEIHRVDESETVNWSAGGSGGFGLWSFGADASYNSKKTHSHCDTNNIAIEFELAQIPLNRGWLDGSVLDSRAWKFDPATTPDAESLSDGGVPPKGIMPMYVTSVLFARNVKISLDKTSEDNSYAMTQLRINASGGWGIFSARGNYFRETTHTTHDFVEDKAGLQIAGMQVVGFVCRVLKKCPDPDPNLNWPK